MSVHHTITCIECKHLTLWPCTWLVKSNQSTTTTCPLSIPPLRVIPGSECYTHTHTHTHTHIYIYGASTYWPNQSADRFQPTRCCMCLSLWQLQYELSLAIHQPTHTPLLRFGVRSKVVHWCLHRNFNIAWHCQRKPKQHRLYCFQPNWPNALLRQSH
jgi:hypothetical protein